MTSAREAHLHHALAYRRVAVLLILCVVLAWLASSSTLHDALIGVLVATEELIRAHPLLGASVFIAIAAVSAMFTFASIAILVPAAVFAWGTVPTIAALWLGWILGGIGTYAIGRHLGRPAVRWLISGDSLQRLEYRIPAGAPFPLILLLQMALPSEIVGYVLGLARYPFSRYAAALALAELPYTLATVYLGNGFIEGRGSVILGVGATIAALSLLTLHLWRTTIEGYQESQT
jgi:uncharacterized membrane protein YdjX (TVP38/TMEM64 family)